MAKRPARPASTPWLTPYLTVKDATAALDFYQRAFGFEQRFAMKGPDGKVAHAEMTFNDSLIMFGAESPRHTCAAPATSGHLCPISLYVYCEDVDAQYKRATAAGAKSGSPPEDKFYGDRVCQVFDPDGYSWYFATNVADFDPTKAPQ